MIKAKSDVNIGRFYGGVAALIRSSRTNKYLVLKRAESKDFAPGVWECVTGRVDQGEGFEDALRREVFEEVGISAMAIEFIIGTTHFYRGTDDPENELLGVIYSCVVDESVPIHISHEHSEYRWLTVADMDVMFDAADPDIAWIRHVIERTDIVRSYLPDALLDYYKRTGFELD